MDWTKLSPEDMRLLRQAARRGWKVPDELRDEALIGLARVLARADSVDRDRIAAAKTLAAMDRVDQADEKLALDRLKLERDLPQEAEVSVADAVRAMEEAGLEYDREACGGGDGEMPSGPDALQPHDPRP